MLGNMFKRAHVEAVKHLVTWAAACLLLKMMTSPVRTVDSRSRTSMRVRKRDWAQPMARDAGLALLLATPEAAG